jgi:hypothetical protein
VVVLRCGIVSGGGKGRLMTVGAMWTNMMRRHGLLGCFRALRSRCRLQERAQIADLGFELIH